MRLPETSAIRADQTRLGRKPLHLHGFEWKTVRLIVRTRHLPVFGSCSFFQWPQRVHLNGDISLMLVRSQSLSNRNPRSVTAPTKPETPTALPTCRWRLDGK